jgi:tellurium resistance protein TerD
MARITKKQTINLIKKAPSLSLVRVALSWDQTMINNQLPDCDVSALMLSSQGTLPNDSYFVFYNNLLSGDGSVKHNGDNRTGRGDGDNETIDVELNAVSDEILQICFVISINNAEVGFNFSNVTNANVKIIDIENNQILCEYYLHESFPDADTLNLGRLYRFENEWHFEALGDAYTGGLQTTLDSLDSSTNNDSVSSPDLTAGESLQQQFSNAFCQIWPDVVVKKIDKDNFLDIHIPSVHPKYGTHLGVNTAKGQIKICFYCRDTEFVEGVVQRNSNLEQYSQGIRPLNNPVFNNINDAVFAANEFLKKIK